MQSLLRKKIMGLPLVGWLSLLVSIEPTHKHKLISKDNTVCESYST